MDLRPNAGIVGPKLVLPSGELDLACRRSFPTPEVIFYRVIQLGRLFPKSRRFGRYNLTFWTQISWLKWIRWWELLC